MFYLELVDFHLLLNEKKTIKDIKISINKKIKIKIPLSKDHLQMCAPNSSIPDLTKKVPDSYLVINVVIDKINSP